VIVTAVHLLVPRLLAPSLAESVKAATGRELSFGEVGVTLWPRPSLVLSQVRLGNASWGSQPWLAQVGRATAELDAWGLLSGQLRIRQVAVTDATVFLETDAAGTGNWVMGSPHATRPAWPEALAIDQLTLKAIAFTYRDGKTGRVTSVRLDAARLAAASASSPIDVDARAAFDGKLIQVGGSIGPLAALLANAPVPVNLEGKLGAASVSARGHVDKPLDLAGFSLALRAEAPELAELAALVGATMPLLGPLRGAAQLSGTAGAMVLTGIDVALGGHGAPQITLSGTVANLRAASGIDLRLAASATDWWRVGESTDGQRLPPFRASARVHGTRQGYRVDDLELRIADSTVNASLQVVPGGPRPRIVGKVSSPLIDLARRPPTSAAITAVGAASAAPARPKPTDHWQLADVDLDLQIARLVFPDGRELRSGSGRLALEKGQLKASALQASLGGARIRLDGSIADAAHLAGFDLGGRLHGDKMTQAFQCCGRAVPLVGPYEGQARLKGAFDALRLTAIDAAAGRPGQRLRVSGQIDDLLHWQGLALVITANIGDSIAAGRLFGVDLPRLPALRATARLSGPRGGYAFDDLDLVLGRTGLQGRVVFAPGEPRPRVTADLAGTLLDLSELPSLQPKPGATSPMLAADVEARLRIERVVLPDRRSLGPLGGVARLEAGAVEFKQFSMAVDGASATVDGRIGDPLRLAGLDLVLSADVKRGAGLAAFTGLSLQALPAFTASARLTDAPAGYVFAGLKMATTAATLAGDVAVTRGAKRFKVSAKLTAPSLDASVFLPPDAAAGTAKAAEARSRVIADVPLPLDLLRAVDADVELHIDTVNVRNTVPVGPLLVRVVIADGLLKAEPMQIAGPPNQRLSASVTVDAAKAAWDLQAEGSALDLGTVLARFGHPGVVTGGSTQLALQLRGRGKTLPALLGSLDGEATVAIGPLRVHNFAIDFDRGILARALGLANPSHKTEPDTDIDCVGIRVPVKSGVISTERGIAAETAKYNVVLGGTLNLKTEAIDVAVTPVVKGGRGVVTSSIASVVRVGGTLSAPALAVDPVGVAKTAVGAGVAVLATPWWLADTLLKKIQTDPTPCATALGK